MEGAAGTERPGGAAGVVVLGAARSGTSAVARALVAGGFFAGTEAELLGPLHSNPVGHYELVAALDFNEEAIERFGYRGWPEAPTREEQEWHRHEATPQLDVIVESLIAAGEGAPVLLKEPRINNLLPLWQPTIEGVLHPVLVVRDPLEAALSQAERDDVPIAYALAAWETQVTTALEWLDGRTATVAQYGTLVAESEAVEDVLRAAGAHLEPARAERLRPAKAGEGLRPSLRHQRAEGRSRAEHLTGRQMTLWEFLRALPVGDVDFAVPDALLGECEAARAVLRSEGERLRLEEERAEALQRAEERAEDLERRFGEALDLVQRTSAATGDNGNSGAPPTDDGFRQGPRDYAGLEAAIAAGEPVVWCDRPDLHGLREARIPVEVLGWAVAPGGIASVRVLVDGVDRGEPAMGLMRPELAPLVGQENTERCGYFLRLDPSVCMPGKHTLAVVATAHDGRAVGISGEIEFLTEEEFERRTGGRRAELPPGHRYPSPEREARYRWAAGLAGSGRVLDAGCGRGVGTAILAERAREAIGVDLSPPAVEAAQRKHGDRARFEPADVRDLPFADGEFDVAVCFETLQRLENPETALDELRRVLRPDGLLLVSAPNPAAYPAGNPLHRSEISPGELQGMLASRFANVAIHRQQTYFASLLGSAALLSHDSPPVQIGTTTTKVSGGPPGTELHAVAVASDGPLPPEPAQLALGEDVAYRAQEALLKEWQERAVKAEAEAFARAKELRELQP